MKFQKNSLKTNIWLYMILFSVLILAFLWLFQVIFLNSYYEWMRTKDINKITNQIVNNYNSNNNTFETLLDDIAYTNGICIEVVNEEIKPYMLDNYNRSCIGNREKDVLTLRYKMNFIESNKTSDNMKLEHPRFDEKILISSVKLDDNVFLFINAALQPMDSTISILKSQLLFVSIIVLVLSFIISYFISRKISKPIVKISESAKKMVKDEYDVVFSENSNINEINELASSLNYARTELSKTEELRRELLSNVSHDLKTPLTMIKAYAEMVRDLTYKNQKKRTHNLNVIIDEANRLNLLVNDILDLSKMQAMETNLNYENFDLKELIDDILRRYKIYEETKGSNFVFNYKKKAIVYADKKRIEQVMYNLINNAINYTGEDKKVIIDIIAQDETFRVEIRDTGKGIASKDLKLIWDKYYKVDKSYKRNTVGTGIGLSIVKNILIAHKFEYGVDSVKNQGTTFYFEIEKSK